MLIFFGPLYLVAFLFFMDVFKKNFKLIKEMIKFAIIGYFVTDPLATQIKAWSYGENTLDFKLFGTSALENLLWAILLCVFVTIAVLISTDRETRGKAILVPSFISKHFPKKIRDFVNKEL